MTIMIINFHAIKNSVPTLTFFNFIGAWFRKQGKIRKNTPFNNGAIQASMNLINSVIKNGIIDFERFGFSNMKYNENFKTNRYQPLTKKNVQTLLKRWNKI